MHGNNNNIFGFGIGAITGFTKYLASVQVEIVMRVAEAGFTALVCGFLGMAGKEGLSALLKWYKNKKSNKYGSN